MAGVLEGRRLRGDFRWGTPRGTPSHFRHASLLPLVFFTRYFVARCSVLNSSRSGAPLHAPAPAQKSVPRPAEPETKLKADEYEVWVDSEPAGASWS